MIADVANPKSSPLELLATVPDYQIPLVPILQTGEKPFAVMVDLQKKYNWVPDTLSYKSIDTLSKHENQLSLTPPYKSIMNSGQSRRLRSAEDFIEEI